MIGPFLKEKRKWVDSDRCWWCNQARQIREHLFKECKEWKESNTIGKSEDMGRDAKTRKEVEPSGAGEASAMQSGKPRLDQATQRLGTCALCAGGYCTGKYESRSTAARWVRAKRAGKCPNCTVEPVPEGKEVRQAAKGWSSPPPPPRHRRALQGAAWLCGWGQDSGHIYRYPAAVPHPAR